jgi:transposase/DNA-binding CsgD family transcriptional regulator
MANRVRPIMVGEADRAELERLQRASSTPAGLSRRARAVLLMAQGLSGVEIAERIGYTVVQVSRIRRRFAEAGVAGLPERPKSGRPPTVTARQRARVVALTLKPPRPGLSHWSSRDLARQVGVSHSTVHRIWQAHALQPHRLTTFKFSMDPQAEEKIHDVVGLYLHPPTNAVVLSLDEKTQIQALSRTQPLLPLRPGLPARQTHDYQRNGLTSLYAALEVANGRVTGECTAGHTGTDFVRFVQRVARAYPGRALHVILDNSSTHSTPAVQRWLAAHPRVHFHFTPTGASWLNMVEAWFSILTRKSVRRGSFDTVRALIRHIQRYIAEWNTHPTPFVWTKAPADIIKKALRRGH